MQSGGGRAIGLPPGIPRRLHQQASESRLTRAAAFFCWETGSIFATNGTPSAAAGSFYDSRAIGVLSEKRESAGVPIIALRRMRCVTFFRVRLPTRY